MLLRRTLLLALFFLGACCTAYGKKGDLLSALPTDEVRYLCENLSAAQFIADRCKQPGIDLSLVSRVYARAVDLGAFNASNEPLCSATMEEFSARLIELNRSQGLEELCDDLSQAHALSLIILTID